MGIHLIIDGYNLIRQSAELSRIDRQDITRGREALIARLAAYRRLRPHRITVVFDGVQAPHDAPARDRVAGIGVVFSRAGESADTVIQRMARQERDRATVVSSDRALARAAEGSGAAVIAALDFEARMALAAAMNGAAPPESDPPPRRVSTRKKGEGRRLPKRLRQKRQRTAKL